jgi:hypothetical protein
VRSMHASALTVSLCCDVWVDADAVDSVEAWEARLGAAAMAIESAVPSSQHAWQFRPRSPALGSVCCWLQLTLIGRGGRR